MQPTGNLPRKVTPFMKRKTTFVLLLVCALILAWVVIITDKQVRDHLGSTLYIIGFAITGCMILVLAGYAWNQELVKTLKSMHDTTDSVRIGDDRWRATSRTPMRSLAWRARSSGWPVPSSRWRRATRESSRTSRT